MVNLFHVSRVCCDWSDIVDFIWCFCITNDNQRRSIESNLRTVLSSLNSEIYLIISIFMTFEVNIMFSFQPPARQVTESSMPRTTPRSKSTWSMSTRPPVACWTPWRPTPSAARSDEWENQTTASLVWPRRTESCRRTIKHNLRLCRWFHEIKTCFGIKENCFGFRKKGLLDH